MKIAIIYLIVVAIILYWNYRAHRKSKQYESEKNQLDMEITLTKQAANDVEKAISFFVLSNTNVSADYPEGIHELSQERMKLLKMTPAGLKNLSEIAIKIKNEIAIEKPVTI